MNEKPKFIDPMDLPKPPNPELESYKQKVFDSNPECSAKIIELSALLNADQLDTSKFRQQVEDFNEKVENTKGYYGQYTTIETVYGKHGKLLIYYFPKPDSVKFGYTDLN